MSSRVCSSHERPTSIGCSTNGTNQYSSHKTHGYNANKRQFHFGVCHYIATLGVCDCGNYILFSTQFDRDGSVQAACSARFFFPSTSCSSFYELLLFCLIPRIAFARYGRKGTTLSKYFPPARWEIPLTHVPLNNLWKEMESAYFGALALIFHWICSISRFNVNSTRK